MPGLRKLGRQGAHRWSMFRTMVSQLINHERIETTVQKAKELRRVADRMVTLGKQGTEGARRRALAVVRGVAVVDKLFGELAQRYAGRTGGYTRVLQTRRRLGDGAHMAYIEYVARPGELREAMPQPQPALAAQEQEWARQRAGLAAAAKMQRLVGSKTSKGHGHGQAQAQARPQAQDEK